MGRGAGPERDLLDRATARQRAREEMTPKAMDIYRLALAAPVRVNPPTLGGAETETIRGWIPPHHSFD